MARPKGMSPATSLMGAARQFGKIGARGSGGNKSVNPGGKNKPVPGLSPGTAPRIQGVQKMPEPMIPTTGAVFPGGRPKHLSGGAQVQPQPRQTAGPQPIQRGQAKYDQSHAAPMTGKQRYLVRSGTKAVRDVYGNKVARGVKRALKRGIVAEGKQRREPVSKRLAVRAIKRTATKKEARGWRKKYRRVQG